MALKIRLNRGGRRGLPHYNIVVIESTSARDAKFIEKIGHYHPTVKDNTKIVIESERFTYWVKNGAKPSDTVARLLLSIGVSGAQKFKPKYGKSKNMNKSKKEVKRESTQA